MVDKQTRYVAVDVETTGLSPLHGDRIIEIGAMVIEGNELKDEFHSMIDSGYQISRQAEKVHGITHMHWRHSGFSVFCGKAIWPHNQEGLENLARYIIRASFSQEPMRYVAPPDSLDAAAKVIYQSKNGKTTKTFDALDWLAQLVSHIPNRGEQMVRY
jgi:hypothetical protein